jgi:hypothetical protein
LNKQIEALEVKIENRKIKLAEIAEASDNDWESIKNGMETEWNSMKTAYNKAVNKFNKQIAAQLPVAADGASAPPLNGSVRITEGKQINAYA